MDRQIRKFPRYTLREVLLVFGLSSVIFLVSCGYVGYGIEFYSLPRFSFDPIPIKFILKIIPPELILVKILSILFEIKYPDTITMVWLIGILGMVAGLLGIASIARWAIFRVLFRKRAVT
jgi:hypothetical protein